MTTNEEQQPTREQCINYIKFFCQNEEQQKIYIQRLDEVFPNDEKTIRNYILTGKH